MRLTALVLLAGVALGACASYSPGTVQTSTGSPLVAVGAGKVYVGGGIAEPAWYIVDPATQTCWILTADGALAALDCCRLRRVVAARPHITWENKESCARAKAAARSGCQPCQVAPAPAVPAAPVAPVAVSPPPAEAPQP